jgi:hypothetical protein
MVLMLFDLEELKQLKVVLEDAREPKLLDRIEQAIQEEENSSQMWEELFRASNAVLEQMLEELPKLEPMLEDLNSALGEDKVKAG